jgi:hypothetical protein
MSRALCARIRESQKPSFQRRTNCENAIFGTIIRLYISVTAIDQSLQSKRFFDLTEHQKSIAAHPAAANPHRGYSCVGQEFLAKVSGFEKGECRNLSTIDIKVHLHR